MRSRPRTAYVRKLKARRCNRCGGKLNTYQTRCKRCSTSQSLPKKKQKANG